MKRPLSSHRSLRLMSWQAGSTWQKDAKVAWSDELLGEKEISMKKTGSLERGKKVPVMTFQKNNILLLFPHFAKTFKAKCPVSCVKSAFSFI